MAWTAPSTYVVSQVVTAAILNTDVRDNLKYLHGDSGAIALVNTLTANAGAASTDILAALSGNSANYAGFAVGRAATEARFAVPAAAGQFAAGAAAGDAIVRVDDAAKKVLIGSGGTETVTIRGSTDGMPFMAKGAGGGFATLSAAVVTTIQTLAAAGTVLSGAVFYIVDRNNTTGTTYLATSGIALALGGTITYVNTDTIVVTLTAGGGITVARTVGTNGSHQVNMFILFY